jgi:hypothetical protein
VVPYSFPLVSSISAVKGSAPPRGRGDHTGGIHAENGAATRSPISRRSVEVAIGGLEEWRDRMGAVCPVKIGQRREDLRWGNGYSRT